MIRHFFSSISNRISNGNPRDGVPLLNLPIDDTQNDVNTSSIPRVQTHSSASINGGCLYDSGVHLRAKLRFFFMSPCWKWYLKHQCPWKAWFQFVKIIILTAQLILFGIERETHVIFISESNITFHHLFVRNWELSFETLPYPRASGDFSVFTNEDFVDSINYAVQRFNNLTKISVGLFAFHDHSADYTQKHHGQTEERFVNLCFNRFKTCQMDPGSHGYVLHTEIENVCFKFNASDDFNVEEYLLNEHNETINYCGLNLLTLDFAIHAIQLKNQAPFSLPDCYHFAVQVIFDNNARTGKIRQRLNSQAHFQTCNSKIINENSTLTSARRNLLVSFDCLVLCVTVMSFILCIRSLWVGHQLGKEVRKYYSLKRRDETPLTASELQVFYSFWYFLMIITDLMVIPGTIIKITISFKVIDDYNAAGLLLGLSSLLSWFGILRYLTFYRKYNLLFLTIQRALPVLLRFLLCAMIMFCGFVFCGWIVLGPYHTKFRTLATTFETLFGLLNGDDMYTTFANIETESKYIWLFSEIYLYSFSCLFIFVISSLIIALIIDGYDTVKKYYTDGFPKSRLQKFSEEDLPQWLGIEDWQDLTTAIESRPVCFPCCCRTPKELTDLIARDTYLTRNANAFS